MTGKGITPGALADAPTGRLCKPYGGVWSW